jgi:hypothetical protein
VVAATVAMISGHPGIGEVLFGALTIGIAVLAASTLTPRAAHERDAGRVLVLDFWLVLIVLLGLAGVAVVGLAIPGLH